MHGIIFHMDLQSVPLSFGINDCTKSVPGERECEHCSAPSVGLCSAVLWATSSHHKELLALGVYDLCCYGQCSQRGQRPPPSSNLVTMPSWLEMSSVPPCQSPDSQGSPDTDVPLDPGLTLGSSACSFPLRHAIGPKHTR